MYHGTCKRKCWLEAKVSESTIFSMDLRTPSEKAGNDARQGKMRMKVYFKKTRKGWEMAACKDRNNANQKSKWSKTRPYALCSQCGYTLHSPTPHPTCFSSCHYLHPTWLPSQLCYEYITWGRWCCIGIKSQQPTSQITQVAPRIICRVDEIKQMPFVCLYLQQLIPHQPVF